MTEDELIQEYYEKIPELLGQPRISFLIGAGCSACAGLPFMNELTRQICENLNPDKVSDSEQKIAFELLQEIKNRFDGLQNISIEDFLSEIQDVDAILQRQNSKGVKDPTYPSNGGKYRLFHTQLLLKMVKEEIRKILGREITTIKYHRKFVC